MKSAMSCMDITTPHFDLFGRGQVQYERLGCEVLSALFLNRGLGYQFTLYEYGHAS